MEQSLDGKYLFCIGYLNRTGIRKNFPITLRAGNGYNSPAVHHGKIHNQISISIQWGHLLLSALSLSSSGRSAENHRHSSSNQTPPELSKLQLKTKLCFFRGRLRGKNPKRERYRSVEARPARGIRASGTRHKARHQWRLFLGMDEGMIRGGKSKGGSFEARWVLFLSDEGPSSMHFKRFLVSFVHPMKSTHQVAGCSSESEDCRRDR